MGKSTGFLEYERKDGEVVEPKDRLLNFSEFHKSLPLAEQQTQSARCMSCGIPFCQSGSIIAGMASGCPLHNLMPETNDLVYRGKWEQAYYRLSTTHPLPEFTSRVCPALCESACTCGLHTDPVSVKENERAIIEYAYEHDLVKPNVPAVKTGKKIAIIGSGPSGLAAAEYLNRRGHSITVFERSDMAGGLLRYGIPNMKLDKRVIDRRIDVMVQSGIVFKYGVNVGVDITGEELLKDYDRIILCCGASNPRDLNLPGRDAKGIMFAVDFLKEVTSKLIKSGYVSQKVMNDTKYSFKSLQGKNVIVIGGGDTGNDCVGTALRLGAGSVMQVEMMPKPPVERAYNNPWPEWPKVLKTDYGQEEAIACFGKDPRVYQTTVKEFLQDKRGHLRGVVLVELAFEYDEKQKRNVMKQIEGSEKEYKADLVLIAAGFLGSEKYVCDTFGVECNERTNVKTKPDSYKTSADKIFTAGDMHRGQSLVVWAISEGCHVAKEVDESLMGYSNL